MTSNLGALMFLLHLANRCGASGTSVFPLSRTLRGHGHGHSHEDWDHPGRFAEPFGGSGRASLCFCLEEDYRGFESVSLLQHWISPKYGCLLCWVLRRRSTPRGWNSDSRALPHHDAGLGLEKPCQIDRGVGLRGPHA